MATSGNFTTSNTGGIGANYPKNATYSWWVNSQSIENNTTSIGYKLVLGGGASSGSSIAVYNCSTTTDGAGKSFSGGGTFYGNGKELISGTKTITHNADGTKSFSASATINLYWSSGHAVSGSGTWTLPTIARQAYLSTVQNFNDNGNPTITYTNAAGNAVGTLQACIASSDGNTIYAAYRNINKTGTLSYTFNLTTAERNTLLAACANSNSLAVRFYVKTVIGSTTFYDYKAATMSVVSANPTFSNYTYSDTNSTITAITGNNQVLVANKSTLSVVISSANKAVANKQATMKTYLASLSGKTVSANYSSSGNTLNFTSNAFTAGTQTLSVKATDSRGNATTVNKNVTIVGYSNPVINAVGARQNNFENNTTFTFSGSISPITVGGTRKNDLVGNVQYRYKNQNTSTWGSWTNLTASVAANGTLTINSITLSLDNTASWDMEVKVVDKLATTTKSLVISQGQPQFFVGDDGRVAVGGTPSNSVISGQAGLLEIKGNSYHVGSTGDVMTNAKRTDVNRSVRFGVGAGGTNAGIYDDNAANWMIYDDKTRTYLPRFKESAYNIFCGGGSGSTAGRWLKVGTLNLASHNQGKMIWLRLNIGIGNNGNATQNCYIDLIGQQGYTGSVSGRAGWNAEMHPLQSSLGTSTEKIKVISVSGSNLNYEIWFWTNHTYVAVNSVYFPNRKSDAPDFTWTPTTNGSWTATEPSGTACEIGHTVNTQGAVGITSTTGRLDIGNWHFWYYNWANTSSGWVQKDITLPDGFNTAGRVKHVTANGLWGNSGDNRLGAWIQMNATTLRLRIYQANSGSNGWSVIVFGMW